MKPFSIFVIFYMTAILMEFTETWKNPVFTGIFFVMTTIFIFTKITRFRFLFFLVLTTLFFLGVHFPEVTNHVNLIIFCNISLIAGVIYSLIRPSRFPSDDDYFDMMLPYIRVTLIPVYFLAGFDKLNSDFFNPDVSCATVMLLRLKNMLASNLWGFPTSLVIAVGLGLAAWKAYDRRLPILNKSHLYKALFLGAGLFLLIALILPIMGNSNLKTDIAELLIFATMVLVLAWELMGGLFLAVPKLQATVLLLAWAMHSALAMIGIVDFTSLAFTLLLTFIPKSYQEVINSNAWVRILNYQIHRVHIYFLLNAMGGLLSGIHYLFYPVFNITVITGILLNSASIIFVFPILSRLFSSEKLPPWSGVSVINKRTPKLVYVYLLFLILYGMTSYFGLRTAGNYSMYSNLRTEGELSNHLFLKNNPLKIWTYQEDVVHFIEIDDESSKIGHKYRPLKGNQLPAVEFRKLICKWKEAGRKIPLKFEYKGMVYETEDIVNDPRWSIENRDWEMFLMDFRVIQPEGPNKCRW